MVQEKPPEMLLPGQYPEEEDPMPFQGLEKSSAVQETRAFASASISERKCLQALVKMLYLFGQGEQLTATEATDIFFGATKLFQSENQELRRQVYVLMKELAAYAEQMFIATQILCKDINSNNDMYKANAIRLLGKITEVSMLGPGERFIQQAIVDKNPNVSSAALVTCIHLAKEAPDMVRKWSNEVGEALKQQHTMVQYHALGLQQRLKKGNRLFVLKTVQSVQTIPIKTPYALCLLIRMCTEVLLDDFANNKEIFEFVKASTRHGSEIVVFEAARSICSLPNLGKSDLAPVVHALQVYLAFHKPVLKFAALRLLNKMAATHPLAVAPCCLDMETLFSCPNKNIATLAITTLLMTGGEHSIDRLMKDIARFMSDISSDFKSVVIDSMKVLAKKFPHKHPALLSFLGKALHEESDFEYMMSVVETIADLVEWNEAAREEGLLILCMLIEDCEYNEITKRILALLGKLGPQNTNPSKYVRYIYNRALLGTPSVRAAAVSALAKFAQRCPPLRESLLTVLRRAAVDNDEEVRDRAIFFIELLEINDPELLQLFMTDVEDEARTRQPVASSTGEAPPPQEPQGGSTGLLSIAVPKEEDSKWVQELETVPQLKKLGKPFKSSEPLTLTEKDFDYVVTCVKHCYKEHMLLHFKVTNSLEDQSLHNVQMRVALQDDEDLAEFEPLYALSAKEIAPQSDASTYILLKRDPDGGYPTGSCAVTILFALEDDEEADEADLPEELVFNLSDYLAKKYLPDFDAAWEAAGEETEVVYELDTMKNPQVATNEILDFYAFAPHKGSEHVEGSNVLQHTVYLSGQVCYDPPFDILIEAQIALTSRGSVILTLKVKGGYPELRTHLCEAVTA